MLLSFSEPCHGKKDKASYMFVTTHALTQGKYIFLMHNITSYDLCII